MGFRDAVWTRRLVVACVVAGSCGAAAVSAAAAVPHKSLPSSCPAAAKLTRPAGAALTRKQSTKSGGTIVCSYTNSKYANLTFDISTVPGVNSSAFDTAMGIQAKAQHATVKTIHGLGSAAVEFTAKDAKTDADGIATTTVAALVGDKEVVVVATLPAKHVLDIAHALI
jgi:opacity protein-like surface antigen